MEETTDLMEFLNLLISLGSFQKCEPAQKRVVVASKKLGQYQPFGCQPVFLRKEGKKRRKKKFIYPCCYSRREAGVLQLYGVFVNIFRKPNMSHNERSHDETTRHPFRPDRRSVGHLFTNQTHADASCFGCFSL
jgi:hypothetical protein